MARTRSVKASNCCSAKKLKPARRRSACKKAVVLSSSPRASRLAAEEESEEATAAHNEGKKTKKVRLKIEDCPNLASRRLFTLSFSGELLALSLWYFLTTRALNFKLEGVVLGLAGLGLVMMLL